MGAEETLFQRFGKEFPKGTVLFRDGDPGKEMFVLQSGKVAISKKVREVEKVLATLGPGEFFGEMAIISNKPRNATATVSQDARVLVIDPKTFEGMIRGNGEIAVDFHLRDLPRELGVGEPAIRIVMSKLERGGLLERSGDRLTVHDTARLRDYLQYLEMKWKFGDL